MHSEEKKERQYTLCVEQLRMSMCKCTAVCMCSVPRKESRIYSHTKVLTCKVILAVVNTTWVIEHNLLTVVLSHPTQDYRSGPNEVHASKRA